MERETTSEQIKSEMKRLGLTVYTLADHLGINPAKVEMSLKTNCWKPYEVFYMHFNLGLKFE